MRISYAQNGEDIVLARLFDHQKHGFYVDVGAGYPVEDSVTKLLSDAGWTGINIEPEPNLFRQIAKERPNDRNYRCAIDRDKDSVELHIYPAKWGWATTDRLIHNGHVADGMESRCEVVPARTLSSILHEVNPNRIDLLKIDAEGSESVVLESFELSEFRPRIMVIEATWPGTSVPTYHNWEPGLLNAGYDMVLFDGLNRFYASSDDHTARSALAAPANSLDNFVPYKWWRLLDPQTQQQLIDK